MAMYSACDSGPSCAIIRDRRSASDRRTGAASAIAIAAGDQARVMTPAQAIRAGASQLVIGRPISAAADPAEAFAACCRELG